MVTLTGSPFKGNQLKAATGKIVHVWLLVVGLGFGPHTYFSLAQNHFNPSHAFFAGAPTSSLSSSVLSSQLGHTISSRRNLTHPTPFFNIWQFHCRAFPYRRVCSWCHRRRSIICGSSGRIRVAASHVRLISPRPFQQVSLVVQPRNAPRLMRIRERDGRT